LTPLTKNVVKNNVDIFGRDSKSDRN